MLDAIARASVDGAILAGIVWCICRAVPRLSPAARATLWWCVAARFVVGLVAAPVMLPVLPAPSPSTPNVATPNFATSNSRAPVASPVSGGQAAGRREPGVETWKLGAALLWFAGVGISLLLAMRRRLRIRQVTARAAAADEALARCARDVASLLGLRRAPGIRLTPEIESPLVSGLLRPVILMPARFPGMPSEQQRMALCHELAHVKRGDILLGCVPAIAERLFFFHPLVRLAAREYAFWREAACDAAVIDALDTAPQSYGRLLLDLGVTGRAATLSPAGAAWSFSNLKRRIIMLRRPSTLSPGTRVLTAAAVAAAFAGIVPLQLTARPVLPAVPAAAAATVSPAPVIEAGPAVEPQTSRVDRDLRYVFFVNDEHTTMSGRSGDIERARRHRRAGEPMLWFITGGDEYVVRDAELLANLQSIWSEVGRIGAEQGEIGAKQGALGARQGEIGAKQGMLGAEQGLLGAKQGTLGARQAALTAREISRPAGDERAEIERERRAIEKEMRELDAQMRALDEKMRQLDRPMRDLGDDMEVLGREMEQLGRKMEDASRKAEAEMRALVEKAIRSGAAQRVR